MYIIVLIAVAWPDLVGSGRHKMVSELREMSKKWHSLTCWWMGMLQDGIIAIISTLILDHPEKWRLKRRF
jgi:hypothetical protein